MNKKKRPVISIYHDDRRVKENGTCPVKLRVFYSGTVRFYPLGIDITPEDFERSYGSQKPRKDFRELKDKIASLELKGKKTAEAINDFSFEVFKKRMDLHSSDKDNVFSDYGSYIKTLRDNESISTAVSYECSRASLQSYLKVIGEDSTRLPYSYVTPDFLRGYEKWMQRQGKAVSTVGIYLRPLRAIFNLAKDKGDITGEIYPFGKRKFRIPGGRSMKKALSREDLRKLFETQPANNHQRKARDFWFFSFQCNGINFKDIAELKYKNVQGDMIVFLRSKTRHTAKEDSKEIAAVNTDFIKSIINTYGNRPASPDKYVFPIYRDGMTAEQRHRTSLNFIRYVNQHLKKFAAYAGIEADISTYWARHSYATAAIRNGASMEYVSETLGHSNVAITQVYFKGFEESTRKDIAGGIMKF